MKPFPLSYAVVAGIAGLAACLGGTVSTRVPRTADTTPVAEASASSDITVANASPPAPLEVSPARFESSFDAQTFQRGNLHTHTNRSDGDSSPDKVAAWYRENGYQFLVISDHNQLTDPAKLQKEQRPDFVLIGGEEVTMRGAGRKVHINALCTTKRVGGGQFPNPLAAIAWASKKIHAQNGLVLLNHPNYEWSLRRSEVVDPPGIDLLEITSGHPNVHTDGDATHPSHEALWDQRLATGHLLMGVGVDDMHHMWLKHRTPARPGRAWVEVFAEQTTKQSICEAMSAGRLYTSTGVKLARVQVNAGSYSVELAAGQAKGTIEFLSNGKTLQTSPIESNSPVSYLAKGNEGWVRAKIHVDNVGAAWTPPVKVIPNAVTLPSNDSPPN